MASSCSSDGVQDDIDSFSGDISELTGSKPIRAAKVADIRQAAAEDSPSVFLHNEVVLWH